MDQVVQINADGTVSDRVMNFWAGGAQACLEAKVCSDLPAMATARITVNSNRVSFSEVVATQARLDAVAGNLLIRQEAIVAIPEWTATLDGQRLTLRATALPKVSTLVRIDPDRLRRLHAGMRASSFAAEDHWRCYLGNATAGDGAFAPLRAGRQATRAPDFLDRYLKVASYLGAVRSLAADDEAARKHVEATPEELMVASLDGIARPVSAEDRQRLNEVLTYVDRHTRALVAYNAAHAGANAARSRAAAAAREAAGQESAAKNASAGSSAAEAKSSAANAEHERLKALPATHAHGREGRGRGGEDRRDGRGAEGKHQQRRGVCGGSDPPRRAGAAAQGARRAHLHRRPAAAPQGLDPRGHRAEADRRAGPGRDRAAEAEGRRRGIRRRRPAEEGRRSALCRRHAAAEIRGGPPRRGDAAAEGPSHCPVGAAFAELGRRGAEGLGGDLGADAAQPDAHHRCERRRRARRVRRSPRPCARPPRPRPRSPRR